MFILRYYPDYPEMRATPQYLVSLEYAFKYTEDLNLASKFTLKDLSDRFISCVRNQPGIFMVPVDVIWVVLYTSAEEIEVYLTEADASKRCNELATQNKLRVSYRPAQVNSTFTRS